MSANRMSIRPSLRFILLAFLGISITGTSSARIWKKKDGTELEADFVKYEAATKTLTVNAGGKEQTIPAGDLIPEDQERLRKRKNADAVPASPEVAKDEIFSLLGKSTADVTGALKRLKLVEDMESVKTTKIRNRKDTMDGIDHSYDDDRITLRIFNDKVYTINLNLMNGYKGSLPFGLKKDMTQKVSGARLDSLGFQLLDWGYIEPGWGVARALDNTSPEQIVAIMTNKPDAPELAIIRMKLEP